MSYYSLLMVTAKNMTGKEAGQMWIDRRCIEEAAEVIPGFIRGMVLESDEEANKICIMCVWKAKSDYEAWVASPLRDKQTADLTPKISADSVTYGFEEVHDVEKPSST